MGGMADAAAGAGARGAPKARRGKKNPALDDVGGGISKANNLKVKGKKITEAQRRNINEVLAVGKKMGANQKVLETAVSTMIQESGADNLPGGDRDSIGLFQQRPSVKVWGTAQQIKDPKHAAKKFFEKAIANDKKNPGQMKTLLAQSVQRSAFPTAYAKWDKEAAAIVKSWMVKPGPMKSPLIDPVNPAVLGGGATRRSVQSPVRDGQP